MASGYRSSSLSLEDVVFLQAAIMGTGVDCLFYGIQTALLASALAALALGGSNHSLQKLTLSKILVFCQYLINDVIVVWRAWIIWPQSRIVKSLLVLCMCGSTGGVVYLNYTCVMGNTAMLGQAGVKHIMVSTMPSLVASIPLLATNVVATSMIGKCVWHYRRSIKASLGLKRKSRVEKVLILLVESGCLYGTIWFVMLAASAFGASSEFPAFSVIDQFLHCLSGIYPTTLVLVIAMLGPDASLLSTAHLCSVSEREPPQFAAGDGATGISTMATDLEMRDIIVSSHKALDLKVQSTKCGIESDELCVQNELDAPEEITLVLRKGNSSRTTSDASIR
ncbi:hypothetical protein HDZ31DRAFT_76164 [Schizophyllum fasciatum]